MEATITITTDQLFDLLKEANFSAPEKMKVLNILFEHRSYSTKPQMIGEISQFIYEN